MRAQPSRKPPCGTRKGNNTIAPAARPAHRFQCERVRERIAACGAKRVEKSTCALQTVALVPSAGDRRAENEALVAEDAPRGNRAVSSPGAGTHATAAAAAEAPLHVQYPPLLCLEQWLCVRHSPALDGTGYRFLRVARPRGGRRRSLSPSSHGWPRAGLGPATTQVTSQNSSASEETGGVVLRIEEAASLGARGLSGSGGSGGGSAESAVVEIQALSSKLLDPLSNLLQELHPDATAESPGVSEEGRHPGARYSQWISRGTTRRAVCAGPYTVQQRYSHKKQGPGGGTRWVSAGRYGSESASPREASGAPRRNASGRVARVRRRKLC